MLVFIDLRLCFCTVSQRGNEEYGIYRVVLYGVCAAYSAPLRKYSERTLSISITWPLYSLYSFVCFVIVIVTLVFIPTEDGWERGKHCSLEKILVFRVFLYRKTVFLHSLTTWERGTSMLPMLMLLCSYSNPPYSKGNILQSTILVSNRW